MTTSKGISFKEGLLAAVTLSGLPCGLRHLEQARRNHSCSETFLGVCECVPGIGLVIALAEKTCCFTGRLFQRLQDEDLTSSLPPAPHSSSWRPRLLPPSETFKKMLKNLQKAEIAFRVEKGCGNNFVISNDPVSFETLQVLPSTPMRYRLSCSSSRGFRQTMEDEHLFIETKKGEIIAAIFDGHGGIFGKDVKLMSNPQIKRYKKVKESALEENAPKVKEDEMPGVKTEKGSKTSIEEIRKEEENSIQNPGQIVATLLKERFTKKFFEKLELLEGNAHAAFERTIYELNQEINSIPGLETIGSTATICYVDEKGRVYTANIGDSAAFILRKQNGIWKFIPLSCVRTWKNYKEACRAAIVFQNPEVVQRYLSTRKEIRFPREKFGITLSRSLGDAAFSTHNGHPGVIAKPKITINALQEGDILFLGCDGITEECPPEEILKVVSEKGFTEDLAQQLTHAAIRSGSQDNVTVLTVHCAKKTA